MRAALRRLAPLAVVGSLLMVVAVLTSMSTVGIHRLPLHTRASSSASTRDHVASTATEAVFGVSRGENGRFEVPAWLGPVLGAILGALMLCLVAFLVWRMLAGAPAIRAASLATKAGLHLRTRHDPVLDAVDAGIAELGRDDDGDGDARFAVRGDHLLGWTTFPRTTNRALLAEVASDGAAISSSYAVARPPVMRSSSGSARSASE